MVWIGHGVRFFFWIAVNRWKGFDVMGESLTVLLVNNNV